MMISISNLLRKTGLPALPADGSSVTWTRHFKPDPEADQEGGVVTASLMIEAGRVSFSLGDHIAGTGGFSVDSGYIEMTPTNLDAFEAFATEIRAGMKRCAYLLAHKV